MSNGIIQCPCGATLRRPVGAAGTKLRCPQCKEVLDAASVDAVPADDAPGDEAATPRPPAAGCDLPSLDAPPDEQTICPICQTAFAAGEDVVACPACRQTHHRECWAEVGGCGTFGCTRAPAPDKSDDTVAAPLAAWGDTKKCPACGESIKSIALKCRYCETRFSTVDPLTAADLRTQATTQDQTAAFRKKVVLLFVLSLVGLLAPVIAVIAAIYLIPRREQLNKAGPLYKIMGWTALGLSCVYTVLIGLFFLADM